MEKELCRLKTVLVSKRVSIELIDRLVSCLQDANDLSQPAIAAARASSLHALATELDLLPDVTHGASADKELIRCLFGHNFNAPLFLDQYGQDILHTLQSLPSSGERLQYLSGNLTYFRRYSLTKSAFFPGLPSTKEYMLNILQEEFQHTLISQIMIMQKPADHTEKLSLNLSVAQLALLIRLQADEGLYRITNITELLRFTTQHYSSKKQDDFSLRNLAKEYYGSNQVTAAVVRDLLLRMVARINKTFFP